MNGKRVAELRRIWSKRKPLVWTAYSVARRGGLSWRAFKRAWMRGEVKA